MRNKTLKFIKFSKENMNTKLPRKKKKQFKKLLLEYLTLIELDKLFNNVEYILNKN
jgi:hypothetical protein